MKDHSFIGLAGAFAALFGYIAQGVEFAYWRNPVPTGEDLYGIAYGHGKFAIVGAGGALLISTNGTDWVHPVPSAKFSLWDVVFADERFLAVGGRAARYGRSEIVTSSDGLNWKWVQPPWSSTSCILSPASATTPMMTTFGPRAQIKAVAHGNGIFVANAFSTILLSENGLAWEKVACVDYGTDLAFGNGRFVLVGCRSGIAVSSNGRNWTFHDYPTSDALLGLHYGNSTFVAVGRAGEIATSSDTVNWTRQASRTTATLHAVTAKAGTYFCVGDTGTILTSSDGAFWTPQASPTTNDLLAVAVGADTILAAGRRGTILQSHDGTNWVCVSSTVVDTALFDVHYAKGMFVAVGASGVVAQSSKGESWKLRSSGTSNRLFAVTANEETFAAVGAAGTIATSSDGASWQSQSLNAMGDFSGVTYGNGAFVAVTRVGQVWHSTDAASWKRVREPSFYSSSVAFGDGRFVICAADRHENFLVSTNGIDWVIGMPTGVNRLEDIAFGNGAFVAVGDYSNHNSVPIIVRTIDGITYSSHWSVNSDGCCDLYSIAFGNGTFVGGGINGSTVYSVGGNRWTEAEAPTSDIIAGIAFGNGTFVAVGYRGTILQSLPVTGLESKSPGQVLIWGTIGQSYQIESSDGLRTTNIWQTIAQTNLSENPTLWVDPRPASGQRFYRTVTLP